MRLNAEELLAVVNGDAEPDRLADLLDRLEQCSESADELRVLVTLRANREQSLEAIQEAAEAESRLPIVHPSARNFVPESTGWSTRALRLAASIALVAAVGVWGANYLFRTASVAALATQTYEDAEKRPVTSIERTSASINSIDQVATLLADGRYGDARTLLQGMPDDEEGYVSMYLGMSNYFLHNYEAALTQLTEVEVGARASSGIRHQASWYKANALLALNRPMDALLALERLRSANSDFPYQPKAAEAYEELCDVLGLKSPGGSGD